MKVSVKNLKACERVLTIEVDPQAVKKEYDLFYQEIAPKARIPGFRPGKAPRSVLENHFAHEAKDRVLKNLISDSFREALQDTALQPLIYPKIQDIDFSQDRLTYKAHIEVRPKIKLGKIKGLTAKKEEPAVEEKEIEGELNRVRESLVQFKAVEDRAAQTGDVVIGDYTCTVEGKEIDKRTDDWLEIREDAFLKDFTDQLIGLKPGDEKEINVVLPDTLGRKELSGKPALFRVKVKELKMKVLPELNDDLAKEAGELNTLQELKDKIRTDLLARKQQQKETEFENSLLEELVKNNKIDLPEGLIQKRLEYLLDEARRGFLSQGADESAFEAQKEKLMSGLEAEAKRQVHLSFLLDEVARQENILAQEADFQERFEAISKRVNQPVDRIKSFYDEKQEARDSLAEQIRNEKTILFIKQHAKLKR